MEILDGQRHDRRAERLKVQRIASLLNGGHHWGRLAHPLAAQHYAPEMRQQANKAFTKSLCALVDQWIDSGKGSNGEVPSKRDVNAIPPGYDESLYDVLLAWLRRNMPKTALLGTGKVGVIDQPPSMLALDAEGRARYLSLSELKVYARECAIYHFKELLASPSALCLSRCGNPRCAAPYYVRARVRKKEIKRGAYCRNCTGVGSAERVRLGRQVQKQMLIELAADVWGGFRPTDRHPRKVDWVADEIKKRNRALDIVPITGKWVSQNQKAIETEMERRKHAKG